MSKFLVVADTNVFINAYFGLGFFKKDEEIVQLITAGKITLATSRYSQNELYKIMARKIEELNIFECREIISSIKRIHDISKYVDSPLKTEKISTDRSDQNFVDLAAHVRANYLITNDFNNQILAKKQLGVVNFVTPEQFLRQYRKLSKKSN